jgi:hypothetical protein
VSAAEVKRLPWWFEPATIVVALSGFTIYVFWTILFPTPAPFRHGEFHNYLSPFYSPKLAGGPLWGWFSPAFLVLWVPLGFRATCYYYRKAYYRSFFWDPPACARPELRGERYAGETKFPFILNNLHRYFFWLATIILAFLWYDTVLAFFFEGRFGVRLGSLIFLANVVLLTFYSLSCHSLRHLIGGKLDCFSCALAGGLRHRSWEKVSRLNESHMLWAWLSLFSVWSVDIYIRLLQVGAIPDLRFF